MTLPPNRLGRPQAPEPDRTSDRSDGIARLLITGATGFVGRHAMATFTQALGPDRVIGLGRTATPEALAGASCRALDLLDAEPLGRFVAEYRPTHVLHLAGLSSVRQAMASPAQAWRTNLLGLLNLCEAVTAGAPGSTFLFVSSGEVYGRAFLSGSPVTEETEPLPANGYARTKHAGEHMLADILSAAGVKTIILRPFNHIGRGQDERFVAASFAGQVARIEARRADAVLEVGDLSVRRDFLDVADVVAAYLAVARHAVSLSSGCVFNIASGRARPISDIVEGLSRLARVPFDIRTHPERLRPVEIQTASGDASALTRAVGWTPRVAWDVTLANLLDDARSRVSSAMGA